MFVIFFISFFLFACNSNYSEQIEKPFLERSSDDLLAVLAQASSLEVRKVEDQRKPSMETRRIMDEGSRRVEDQQEPSMETRKIMDEGSRRVEDQQEPSMETRKIMDEGSRQVEDQRKSSIETSVDEGLRQEENPEWVEKLKGKVVDSKKRKAPFQSDLVGEGKNQKESKKEEQAHSTSLESLITH